MRQANAEFVMAVLKAFGSPHGEDCDDLSWRVDGEFAPITFFVNCGDLFYWACADSEEVTPDNLHLFEEACRDLAGVERGRIYASSLFCCRSRKMRPQRPCYKNWSPEVSALFDACGPERDRKDEG